MEEEIDFYLLTIRKDDQLYANVYEDEKSLREAITSYHEKYPLKLFRLVKTFGTSYDLAVAKKDNRLVVCLGPKKDIPDNVVNVFKCKKKELDFEDFLPSMVEF
jgi:hypothetical protein